MVKSCRKYWYVLKTALNERLVYRSDFFLGTLMRFAPMITTIFLWREIYHGSNSQEFNGLSYQNMVAYYLLTMISRAFSSMPGLSRGIALEIREGTIQKYLIQPIDQLYYLMMTRLAHKLIYYTIATGPFVIVFTLCHAFLPGWPDSLLVFAGYLTSLVLGFFLGFFFEVCIGLLSFWFLEISSFLFIVMSLNYFLSGHMVPLDLLPTPLADILQWLPFKFFAYFPSMVILGKIQPDELAGGLLIELGWVTFFVLFSRFLYRRGLRRYSAFGG